MKHIILEGVDNTGKSSLARELAKDFDGAKNAYNKTLELNPSFTEATRALNRIRNN
jgi:MoxR-like ATPase